MLKDVVVVQRPEFLDDEKHSNQKSEIADAVNDEGFFAGIGGGIFEKEKSDEQIRGQAHALPAHEQQQIARSQHQREHEEHEQVEITEKAIVAALVLHVSDGVDVDEEADTSDHQDHHQRELVKIEAEISLESAGDNPWRVLLDVGNLAGGKLEELYGVEDCNCERRRDRKHAN